MVLCTLQSVYVSFDLGLNARGPETLVVPTFNVHTYRVHMYRPFMLHIYMQSEIELEDLI